MLSFLPESLRKPALIVIIVLASILFLKFTPFLGDAKTSISGWLNERARQSLEKDIAKMQDKIDSTNKAIDGIQRKNDSLSWEIKVLDGRIYARIRSIDSLKGVVATLEGARKEQGSKEKVDDSKITNKGHFVDSLLRYRDSSAATK
jgi:peptidoglycan hydrolase CwlO-like protein